MAAGTARARFEVEVKSELDKLNRQLEKTNAQMGKVAKSGKSTAKSVGFLEGATKAVGVAFAAWQSAQWVVGFLGDTLRASSALTESMSKSSVVFGSASDSVTAWASNSAMAFGQSKQQAVEAAATFGNLFVTMGIGERASADMSKELVGLASDLASFNNTSPDEALQALRSGLAGEVEPLRRYGVLLNDATLKQAALNAGLIDNTKGVLPPQIRAQAAYRLILEQTTTAQGDFARTGDQMANSQRKLAAEWENAKAALGNVVTPEATKSVSDLAHDLDLLQKKGAKALFSKEMWSDSTAVTNAQRTALSKTAKQFDALKSAASAATKAQQEYKDSTAVSNDAELEWLRSQERTIAAQKNLTEARKKHKKGSRDVRIAELELAQARRAEAAAADKARIAGDKALTASKKSKKARDHLALIKAVEDAWKRASYQVGIYNTRIALGTTGASKQLSGDNQIPWTVPKKKTKKAQGGISYAPTLTMIGENGPEAVIPLGHGGGIGNTVIVNLTVAPGMSNAGVTEAARQGAAAGVRESQLRAQMMGAN